MSFPPELYKPGPWKALKERRASSRQDEETFLESVAIFEQCLAAAKERTGLIASPEVYREIAMEFYRAGMARGAQLMKTGAL